jgi:hypothetical protein
LRKNGEAKNTERFLSKSTGRRLKTAEDTIEYRPSANVREKAIPKLCPFDPRLASPVQSQ